MDNVSIHNTEKARNILEGYRVRRLHIPPYSPDMNIMEHFWANLKAKLAAAYRREEYHTIAQMDRQALAIWQAIEVTKTLEDYKATLQAIIDSGGEFNGG